MKKNILLLSSALLLPTLFSCGNKESTSTSYSEEDTVHLIILAGQSGARGKALVADLNDDDRQENEDVDIIADGLTMDRLDNIPTSISDDVVINPLGPGFGDYPSECGPEIGMGKTLESFYPKGNALYKSVIVKYTASGSTLLNHWYSASSVSDPEIASSLDLSQQNEGTGPLTHNLYELIDNTVSMLSDYGYRSVIDGLAFVHGEQDAKFAPNMEIYEKALVHFVDDFRSYAGNSNLPVVVTEALTNSAMYANKLREAQQKAGSSAHASFISTSDLYTNTFEPWHFNAESNDILGQRIVAELLGGKNDVRQIDHLDVDSFDVPFGAKVELPTYVEADFTNGKDGYVKVNYSSYNENQLGEQTISATPVGKNNQYPISVNVKNNVSYVDKNLSEYKGETPLSFFEGNGNIYVRHNEEGIYFGFDIKDEDIYTDGENWHSGDMGQKGNNDDIRVYLSTGEGYKTIALSSASLLRVYPEGTTLDSADNELLRNNLVYRKKMDDALYGVKTNGIVNDGKGSSNLIAELYLSFEDLGIVDPSAIKLMFAYDDISMTDGVRNSSVNYAYKGGSAIGDHLENQPELYFGLEDLA